MKKIFAAFVSVILLTGMLVCPVYASSIPQKETPDYKVAFYAFDNYHMQDDFGNCSGYGYEMMRGVSRYLQCTFSFIGYEKSADECEELLRNGEIDIYTAAKVTPKRLEEFAFSTHPAITANTCMNVKVGNTAVVAGDYTTYNGLRIGLLERHTYNDAFLNWADEKGFSYEVIYYNTPTELSNALIDGKVDALVDSYIGTPEDERTIEDFGPTPYYLMVRKEDQALVDALDYAIDCMSLENPNWRSELFNRYYGSQDQNTSFTPEEQTMLKNLQENNAVVRAVMNPDANPYSWYENGEAKGIAADIFTAVAKELGLACEIIPVADRNEYLELLSSGEVDIWVDMNCRYDLDGDTIYRLTSPYLATTVSVLRERGASEKLKTLTVIDDCTAVQKMLSENWPDAQIILAKDTKECVQMVLSGKADGAVLMTYTAQKLARDDVQNRLRVDIIPGAIMELQMGINANDDRDFYGLWEKTLAVIAPQIQAEVIQPYTEESAAPTMIAYLFDHPVYLVVILVITALLIFLIILYFLSVTSRNKQQKITAELSVALQKAEEATEAKTNFFSKMSHDIRTPLNVVLGMTQVAQKYKHDPARLQYALENITSEGNYLLVLINSILDVNQLEHGQIELNHDAFNPAESVRSNVEILRPLADKKSQRLSFSCNQEDCVVTGDVNRYSQIVINIISNAIKYTNPGGQIKVQLDCLPNNRCRFTCTDNGIGMTQEFVQHITEDYVRAEDSRVSKNQGTGLGMSVVKGLVDLMQGTLTVNSTPEIGSTFIVEIPFQEASEKQKESIQNPISMEASHSTRFHGKKVLLVEDNVLNAEIAMELLQGIGLDVDWAENGLIAVNRLASSPKEEYFAVLMDMQMPIMDGITATKEIRSSSHANRDIPIFAMTANTFASDRKLCIDAGMNGYISKPIDIEEIAATLQKGVEL